MATRPDSLEVQGEFDLFAVSLPVFEGPFDLLLSLIARKKLDITEVALAQVTDEFIAFMKASPDLSRTTEFLVVAATLLDMKAAHLLPSVDEEENASEADLEARDLLFSRLLQYRAFKEAAKHIDERINPMTAIIECLLRVVYPAVVRTAMRSVPALPCSATGRPSSSRSYR